MTHPLHGAQSARPGPRRSAIARAIAAAGLLACIAPVSAAEAEPAATADDRETTTLDGLRVTAQRQIDPPYTVRQAGSATRLGLSLRETPQSTTIITRQRLDDMGLFSLADVMSQVTGVFVQYTDSERVSYNSRGYAINNFQVDGMLNAGGYIKANGDSAVYERIEVVRGSTGLTTGAGDPSGMIHMIRKRPTDHFFANAGLTVGSWNNVRVEADLGGPLGFDGRLRGRVVAVQQESESWRDLYALDKRVLYGIVEADLGDNTLLTVGYDYQTPEASGATWGTVPYWGADGKPANLPRNTNFSASWSKWPRKEEQAFARIEHRFGDGWQAKLAYTRNDSATDGFMYYGGEGYPRADGSGISAWTSRFLGSARTDAWEFNLDGPVRLFGREHKVLVGYSAMETDERSPYTETVLPPGYASWAEYSRIGDWRTWDGRVPQFSAVEFGHDSSRTVTRQSAGYFASKLSLSQRMNAVIGTRLSRWETRTEERYNPAGTLDARSGYKIDDVVTPYAGLLYDLDDRLTVYASVTDIFKPQNFKDRDNRYLDPIEGISYELGLKGEFFDGALNATAAVFRSQQDNLAEIDDSVPPRIVNGAEEFAYRSTGKGNRVDGWELELQGSLSEHWNIAAGFTHAKAENAKGVRINANQPTDLFRLNSYYRLPGRWNKFSVGGGVTWQSAIEGTSRRPTGALAANGSPITRAGAIIVQPAFYLLNLSASYRFSEQLTASLNVNNLLDEKYYSRTGFYNGVHWGEPRNVLMNLRVKF